MTYKGIKFMYINIWIKRKLTEHSLFFIIVYDYKTIADFRFYWLYVTLIAYSYELNLL